MIKENTGCVSIYVMMILYTILSMSSMSSISFFLHFSGPLIFELDSICLRQAKRKSRQGFLSSQTWKCFANFRKWKQKFVLFIEEKKDDCKEFTIQWGVTIDSFLFGFFFSLHMTWHFVGFWLWKTLSYFRLEKMLVPTTFSTSFPNWH